MLYLLMCTKPDRSIIWANKVDLFASCVPGLHDQISPTLFEQIWTKLLHTDPKFEQ